MQHHPSHVLVAVALLAAALGAGMPSAIAHLSNSTLYGYTADPEGWILQFAERIDDQSGTSEVLDYAPFDPEAWDDATCYPFRPGSDPAGNAQGAFGLGMRLAGVWDDVNPGHRWLDAVHIQSEDGYTHSQSGWPPGFEHHPDYDGAWIYGHYGSLGAISGDRLFLRVYNPGFSSGADPVLGWFYTVSGGSGIRAASGPYSLNHGWNVLHFPVGEIADPSDLREIGVELGSHHAISGTLFVDAATLGAVTLEEQRYLYLTPDVAWFSAQPGCSTRAVTVYYDDGGALTPGVRGFHVVLNFPPECARVVEIVPGDLLAGYPNHFERQIDNAQGTATFDWVILGATSGVSGCGSLATVTVAAAAGHEASDCCGIVDLDANASRFRDPDNMPLTALLVDGQVAHDVTPPDPVSLTSPTHSGGGHSAHSDVKIEWGTTSDQGTCPVGMRGYYLLLDHDPDGEPDPGAAEYTWFTPWSPDSTGFAHWFPGVADGTWYIHVAGYDWLWNGSPVATYGPIYLDTVPPANVTALDADVTPEADLSADLVWTNPPTDFAGVKIYRRGFGFYPEYDDDGGTTPVWPESPADAVAQGWTEVYDGSGSSFVDQPVVRDYYYYAAFAYDQAHNSAPATPGSRDASLCYWLGDFTLGGSLVVDIYDVLVLSLAYYTQHGDPAYNNICDIGPTTDYGRKSRPTTDNEIEFEDLIILAMNYENACLRQPPLGLPCAGLMQADLVWQDSGDELEVVVRLRDNPGCLLGASVELTYGPGLNYVSAAPGDLWSGPRFFKAQALAGGRVGLDAAALGALSAGDGDHASVHFRRTQPQGPDLGVRISGFRARGPGNIDLAGGSPGQAIGEQDAPHPLLTFGVTSPVLADRALCLVYTLPREAHVTLQVYDPGGRRVATLLDKTQPAGPHEVVWDGLRDTGQRIAAGLYFCRLSTDDTRVTRRLMIVR